MRTYARLENNIVVEIIETESIEGKFHPSLFWVEVPTELVGIVKNGWDYIDGKFADDSIKRNQQEQEERELLDSLLPSEKEMLMAEVEIQTITILMEAGLI